MRRGKRPGAHVIRDAEQARAYLHPVRLRILELVADEPRTMTQVARVLRVHPANLTYQFKKLVRARLIELVEERDTGRVVEKYYRAVAPRFELRGPTATRATRQRALATLRDDVDRAARRLGPDAKVLALLERVRIPERSFARFQAQLERLVGELAETTSDDPDAVTYALTVGLYPATA